jgi:hypothetical protein
MMEGLLDEKTFDGRRRDDAGGDLWRVQTKHRNVDKRITRSGDTENTIANRNIAMAISRDEASTTRSIDREGAVGKEMGLRVGSRGLGTIVEMGTRTVVVMTTNGIDCVLMKSACRVEDMLKDWGITDELSRCNGGIEKKLVDGRGGTRATTVRKLSKLGVIDVERRFSEKIVVHENIIGRRQTGEVNVNGVDAENVVRSKEVKKTVVVR